MFLREAAMEVLCMFLHVNVLQRNRGRGAWPEAAGWLTDERAHTHARRGGAAQIVCDYGPVSKALLRTMTADEASNSK